MNLSRIALIASSRLLPSACLLLLAISAPMLPARQVRAIYLPGSGGPLPKAYLIGAEKSFEVELPQRNLSPEVKLPNGDLTLVALPSLLPADTKIPEGAPRVTIPASWGRCILIFLGDPSNKVFPVRIIPVNASTVNFSKGSTRIYNLSKTTLLGRFGDERVQLKPGKSESFGAPIRDFGSYPMGIDCIPEGETAPRAVCRSVWQHDPESHQILFVIPKEGSILPRIWGVLDNGGDQDKDKDKDKEDP